MKCPNCKNEISTLSKKCNYCGKNIKNRAKSYEYNSCITYNELTKPRTKNSHQSQYNYNKTYKNTKIQKPQQSNYNTPDGTQTEGKIGMSIFGWGVVCDVFCVKATGIMVTTGENAGLTATGNGTAKFINQFEVFDISTVIRNITVENQKIDAVTKILGSRGWVFEFTVSICQMVDADRFTRNNREEAVVR